ncbi:hypothetical protein [Streptomyces sp. NPDC088270]|uniref:hypothetical protein n=1 Tax=Streptomyces sp. NPDC088270 TaxID=3160990 RepID=UPI00344AA39B
MTLRAVRFRAVDVAELAETVCTARGTDVRAVLEEGTDPTAGDPPQPVATIPSIIKSLRDIGHELVTVDETLPRPVVS